MSDENMATAVTGSESVKSPGDSAYLLFVPEPGSVDEHHCYTDKEASDLEAKYQEHLVRYHKAVRKCVTAAVMIPLAIIVVLVVYFTWSRGWISYLALASAFAIIAAGAYVIVVNNPYVQPSPGLTPLRTHELSDLGDIADKHPAVKASVNRWLAAGKTLRDRDLWACRAYANQRDEWISRQDAMQRLRGEASPPTSN